MSYIGIRSEKDTVIEDDQAYEYALERCLHGTEEDQAEFRKMLVEWFYSGDWIYEEDEFKELISFGKDYLGGVFA